MEKRRVVITGMAAITPVGNTIEEFWRSLCEGKSGAGKVTAFDARGFDSQVAAEVKNFDPTPFFNPKEIRRTPSFIQYAVACARTAVADAGLNLAEEDPHQVGVILGSGIGGLRMIEEQHINFLEKGPSRISPFLIPMLIVNMAPGQVAISLGVKGPNSAVATACASGNHAIGDAFRTIQYGDAEVMISGGTESAITPLGFGGFCAMKALSCRNDEPERASRPFDRDRDGFVMGEGAGVIILESLEHARKRGASICAELVGYGLNSDAYHMTAPDPEGEGAADCMAMALRDAGINGEEVSYLNAHGTSTPLNDKVETLAIKRVFGDYGRKLAVSSTKSMTGHLLGAAGGVEFIVCVLAIKNSLVPPTINYENPDPDCDLDYVPNRARPMPVEVVMSNSLGFGGHNATLVVRKFK